MCETFHSKMTLPIEVSEVASEAVIILEDQNYFNDTFHFPEKAKLFFYESLGKSLIKKFINGAEIMWSDNEFFKLIVVVGIEHTVNEMEEMKIVDIFEEDCGERIIVLKDGY